jgi:UDP-2,3-diacylglucosamine pyrophosphatase LpxH
MRVALVSDVHLAGPDDPDQARFLAWLRALEVDQLCLVGDVFDHWWHFGAEPFPQYRPVVDALLEKRLPLVVLAGNHDFHAPAFFTPGRPADVHLADWDGLRVRVAHGDHVDRSARYRLLSAVLRGPGFEGLVTRMGPRRAWAFLGRLGGDARVAPNAALITAQHADARAWLEGGRDLVVYGHTHAPGVFRHTEGVYVNLGDWVDHHTWLLVEDGRVELRTA